MTRNAVDARIAKRHADIPQDGLFEVEGREKNVETTKRVKNVSRGTCPVCGAEDVGQVREGAGLAWREHHRVTWKGAPLRCSGSGQGVTS